MTSFLLQRIESVKADELRPGTPARFSLEQIVEILALACDPPDASEYPISHWTPQALRVEAIKRGIVDQISVRHVGRFLNMWQHYSQRVRLSSLHRRPRELCAVGMPSSTRRSVRHAFRVRSALYRATVRSRLECLAEKPPHPPAGRRHHGFPILLRLGA